MTEPSRTALLLEDEPIIAVDLELALERLGFGVTLIRSKSEAEAWLRDNRPDVAILDVLLYDGRCDDVAARLKDMSVPFIVHSGSSPGEHPDSPLGAGQWFNKPAAAFEVAQAALGLTGRPTSSF